MNRSYDKNNIFNQILNGQLDAVEVYQDETVLAIMDLLPQSKGHILVIPKDPSCNLFDANPETLTKLLPIIQQLGKAVAKAMAADGIAIQQFNGTEAGQTIFHLHFHIIPHFKNIPLKSHNQKMADKSILQTYAQKIKDCL